MIPGAVGSPLGQRKLGGAVRSKPVRLRIAGFEPRATVVPEARETSRHARRTRALASRDLLLCGAVDGACAGSAPDPTSGIRRAVPSLTADVRHALVVFI
jgi:hypothetical protein